MWERMSQSEGGRGSNVDFLSTHPANTKRIKVSWSDNHCCSSHPADGLQQLEKWMPEVRGRVPVGRAIADRHRHCRSEQPRPAARRLLSSGDSSTHSVLLVQAHIGDSSQVASVVCNDAVHSPSMSLMTSLIRSRRVVSRVQQILRRSHLAGALSYHTFGQLRGSSDPIWSLAAASRLFC